jgi:hypothetical protein
VLSLAIGSPLSSLSTFVAKATAINAKHGPFDAVIVVGDLFAEGSDGSEVNGIECKTRGAAGRYALPENVTAKIIETGGEVANNLVFLGKSMTMHLLQG